MDILYDTVGFLIRNTFIAGLIGIAWGIYRIFNGKRRVKQVQKNLDSAKNKKERRKLYTEHNAAEQYKKGGFLFIIVILLALILTIPGTVDYVLDYQNNALVTEEFYVEWKYIPKLKREKVAYRLTDTDGKTKQYFTRLKYLDMLDMEVGEKYIVTYWERTRVLYSRERISTVSDF